MNDDLLLEMHNAIKETVSDKKIGIAFSGGVDSTPVSYTHLTLPTKRIV